MTNSTRKQRIDQLKDWLSRKDNRNLDKTTSKWIIECDQIKTTQAQRDTFIDLLNKLSNTTMEYTKLEPTNGRWIITNSAWNED